MEDKEKQIEEIAKDYYGYSIDLEEDCKFVAEEMYDKGHRKLTEDSVVLSREEYESLKSRADDKCKYDCWLIDMPDFEREKDIKTQANKEMAEKFLQLAYDRTNDKFFIQKVEELAKSLGVEIKE